MFCCLFSPKKKAYKTLPYSRNQAKEKKRKTIFVSGRFVLFFFVEIYVKIVDKNFCKRSAQKSPKDIHAPPKNTGAYSRGTNMTRHHHDFVAPALLFFVQNREERKKKQNKTKVKKKKRKQPKK